MPRSTALFSRPFLPPYYSLQFAPHRMKQFVDRPWLRQRWHVNIASHGIFCLSLRVAGHHQEGYVLGDLPHDSKYFGASHFGHYHIAKYDVYL